MQNPEVVGRAFYFGGGDLKTNFKKNPKLLIKIYQKCEHWAPAKHPAWGIFTRLSHLLTNVQIKNRMLPMPWNLTL